LDEKERKTKRQRRQLSIFRRRRRRREIEKKKKMCVSPQIVHEQLDGMRDLIFARHIFTTINVRGARSMRVWMMISKRVYKMKVRSVTFFFFVWTKFNLNTFPLPLCGKIKHRNARAGELQNR